MVCMNVTECVSGVAGAKPADVPLSAALLPPCSQGSSAGSFLLFSYSLPTFGWDRQNFSVVCLWFSWWTAVPVPKILGWVVSCWNSYKFKICLVLIS